MKKTPFGRTGFQVTALGFGSASIGMLKVDQARAGKILSELLDAWVNVIDTAASYEIAEELIGNTIAHRRGEYVLVSKCGPKSSGLDGDAWSEKLITQSIERSLQRLKTDRIDVMLLHSCDLETLQRGEALGALVKARKAGKIRFAGYSGDNEAAAHAATLPDVAAIETSINICDQVNIDLVLPKCREHNVGVLVKRPIANAPWRNDHVGPFIGYAREYKERFAAMGLTTEDLGYKGDPARLWPEIALRFTLSQPGVNTAVVGSTSLKSVEMNLEIIEKGRQKPEVTEKIRAAFKAAEAKSGKKWVGLT